MKKILISLVMLFIYTTVLFACEMVLAFGVNGRSIGDGSPTLVQVVDDMRFSSLPHGRGLVMYEVGSDSSLPGVLKMQSGNSINTMPHNRKWATSGQIDLYESLTADEIVIDSASYSFGDIKTFLFHRRYGTTGSNMIANPHPWVYQKGDQTISFTHNGDVRMQVLQDYIDANSHLSDPEIESQLRPDPFGVFNQPVDSGLLFAVLLMHIKEADWDFVKGITNAIAKTSLWTSSTNNFLLTDGNSAYAYRSRSTAAPTLKYTRTDNYAVITSVTYMTGTALDRDELLHIERDGTVHRYKDISTTSTTNTNDISIPNPTTHISIYPNPFNPVTRIQWSVGISQCPVASVQRVVIEIFNVRGQKVRSLVNDVFGAGVHSVLWNGTDDAGNILSSGVYFCRIVSDGYAETRRLVLLK